MQSGELKVISICTLLSRYARIRQISKRMKSNLTTMKIYLNSLRHFPPGNVVRISDTFDNNFRAKMIIYNISRRFVGIGLIDVSLSNIPLYMF